MDNGKRKVVMAQMKPRERHEWTAKTPHRRRFKWDKRLLRRSVPLAAVFLCIGAAAVTTALFGGDVQAVMSHVTAGFEYDETLGRLQFELRPMSACISPDGQYAFRGGELSVNVHIPSSGPLETAAVLDAYRQAAAFFADRFPGDAVLLRCHSWLLFPGHRVMLPPTSHIRRFSDTFQYIQTDISPEGSDLWRIFGAADTADPAKLPRETGLQRAYADWLQAGKPVGAGLGIRREPKL